MGYIRRDYTMGLCEESARSGQRRCLSASDLGIVDGLV
jgi:hypothetical protein